MNNELNDLTQKKTEDGLLDKEYDEIVNFVIELKEKHNNATMTDEEMVMSEVLLLMVRNQKHNFDMDGYYHRRLNYVKNKNKYKIPEKEFLDVVWFMQDQYDFDNVKTNEDNRVNFNWSGGSFWLNKNLTIDGSVPRELSELIDEKGIKINH